MQSVESKQREIIVKLQAENASQAEEIKLLRSACKKLVRQSEIHRCAVDIMKRVISGLKQRLSVSTAAYDVLRSN